MVGSDTSKAAMGYIIKRPMVKQSLQTLQTLYTGNDRFSGNDRYSGLQGPDRFFRYIRRLLYL